MKKRYGDTKTFLALSPMAHKVYSETEPLNIFENKNGRYSIAGVICAENLTAEEVNSYLEEMYQEIYED